MKDVQATVIVNIEGSEEEMLNRLQKDARWGIKKAIKEGLAVKESEDYGAFYEIYKKTIGELGVKVETLAHVKEHADILFICSKEDIQIGGAILKVENGIPKLTRAASLKEYRNLQPNNLLYWQCILWSRNKGFSRLDLGGWQINARGQLEGVNKFKERWGEVVYYNKEYPFHIALGRKAVRKFSFFWWLNNKIRGRK